MNLAWLYIHIATYKYLSAFMSNTKCKKLIAFFVLSIVLNLQVDNHTYQYIQLVTHNKIGVKPLLQKIIAYYVMYFIFKSGGNVDRCLHERCTHMERFYFTNFGL